MFNLFAKKEPKSTDILALDIGTQEVKALVFELGEEQGETKGVVKGFGTCNQNLGDMHAGAITDIDSVTSNCIKAIHAATRGELARPRELILGIAGELVKGYTTTVSVDRKAADTKISMAEMKEVVTKIQQKAFERIRKQLAFETGFNEIDVKLISSAVVESRIDGYRISNPIGFQGKSVAMSIFNCFAPLVHLGSMESIAASLGMHISAITAEPYAVSKCITYEDGGDFSAIFIDIGGGTTDIALVSNGGVMGTKMFGVGGRVFTKRIATSMGIPFEDAEALKIAYANGDLNYEGNKQIAEILSEDAQTWLAGVELALEEFEKVELFPSRIYLCGGGSQLPEVKEQLESNWYQSLAFARKPTIQFIEPSQISKFSDPSKLLSGPKHVTPLALANLALQLKEDDPLLQNYSRRR